MILYATLVLVAAERLLELVYARRNTRELLAAGGVEHGGGHYPLFFLLHGSWLAALAILVPADTQPSWPLLGLYLGLQLWRFWVIASLGRHWTTRIITVPDAGLVRSGPYRLMRHPNYLGVAIEIPLLPSAFGAWRLAILFGIVNLALLAWRIREEDKALATSRAL